MEESILLTIKRLVGGIHTDNTVFDSELIAHINNAIGTLMQLGVGPKEGIYILDESNKWYEITTSPRLLGLIQIYIKGKVQLSFDQPTSSFVLSSIENQVKEAEWRINEIVEELKGE